MKQNNIISIILSTLLIAATALSVSCSSQDFGSPMGGISDVVDSGRPYTEVTDHKLALEKSKNLAKALAIWNQANPRPSTEYHLGPDDVLKIEILSLEQPGKVSQLLRTINVDGNISLLYGGTVKVAGFSVTDAQKKIKKSLSGRIIKNPDVTVSVEKYKSAAVVMTGAVTKPGVYYLNRDTRSLLELLAEADGLTGDAGDELFIVRSSRKLTAEQRDRMMSSKSGKDNLVVVDLRKLIDDGDMRLNLWINGGDMITIQPKGKRFIYVLGYVRSPGMFEFDESKNIDAVRAVALAGGLASAGRAANCFLLRKSASGQKMIPVDLTKTIRGTKPPVKLESGDTLVVGSSILAKMAEFIKPSVSAGASYVPAP